ncbi:hypothetical protein [Brevundimonas sp.]|jgi:hypothetical protein|uniref:hypothetical protein n=1 Tax=Brevundimonas sp. TaxID=1871086 RepID=UPI0037C1346D
MTEDVSWGPGGAPPDPTPPAKDPIVLAAQKMVVQVFETMAAQLPELLKAQASPGTQIPEFTEAMFAQLTVQLNRALGTSPTDSGEGK